MIHTCSWGRFFFLFMYMCDCERDRESEGIMPWVSCSRCFKRTHIRIIDNRRLWFNEYICTGESLSTQKYFTNYSSGTYCCGVFRSFMHPFFLTYTSYPRNMSTNSRVVLTHSQAVCVFYGQDMTPENESLYKNKIDGLEALALCYINT